MGQRAAILVYKAKNPDGGLLTKGKSQYQQAIGKASHGTAVAGLCRPVGVEVKERLVGQQDTDDDGGTDWTEKQDHERL